MALGATWTVGLILLASKLVSGYTIDNNFQCPPAEFVTPCKCFTWDPVAGIPDTEIEISCRTTLLNETSLKDLFVRLAGHINKTGAIDRFEALRLENTGVQEITGDVFGDISFKSLDLFGNAELKNFDLNSFNKSTSSLGTICIQGSPLEDKEGKLFKDLSNFDNLETLILSNDQLEGLPEYTFGQKELLNLSYVDFSGNRISNIGRKAFYKLPELHRLNLDNNLIEFVSNETFSFEREESKLMLLFLRFNNLTADSFEEGIFRDMNKTVFVYFNNNKISYLKESIFRPLFEAKSDIFLALWSNPFECDCRSKWLLDDVEYYKKRIHGIRCDDKREIWDYTVAELGKC